MNNALMKLTDLCRYYKRGEHEVRAVDGVSLIFEKGGFVGIVGSSGSGKSTLLNLMAGLDTPTSGQIEVDGTVLGNMTRRELAAYRAHRVGMIFQSFNLISHHSALKNVEMALYFNGTPKRERQKLAGEILENLGLADRLHHCPGDLSGGEQQRVAIARALVKQPEIIFADEPTGNLDHENTLQIGDLLKNLNNDGQTIIMVTHDLAMAKKYAGTTIKMHYGSIADTAGGSNSEGGRP